MRAIIAAAALLLAPLPSLAPAFAPAFAQEFSLDGIVVDRPWSRPTASALGTASVYLTLRNEGEDPDRLVASASPQASAVTLHETVIADGIARMERVEALELAPGETVSLEPLGAHLMLEGLAGPLVAGQRFLLTLTFEKAGSLEITVPVQTGPAPAHHGH